MEKELKKSARIIQEVLVQYGLGINIIEFSESTRTAQEAADSIGCTVGQIAKSIFSGTPNAVFQITPDALLKITNGTVITVQ